jgi:hypothetical protein
MTNARLRGMKLISWISFMILKCVDFCVVQWGQMSGQERKGDFLPKNLMGAVAMALEFDGDDATA